MTVANPASTAPRASQNPTSRRYTRPWEDDALDPEVITVAKAKDRGQDKNVKRVAQKSIKEKRAAKKAKKSSNKSSE